MDQDAELRSRLDRIIGLLELAFAQAIGDARRQVRGDPLNAAILEACGADWVPSGPLQATVSKAVGVSARTVQRRIADLVSRRALETRGATSATEYRATGLI
jgi:hypothetical protein